jgi:hypothetical protein
MRIMSEVPSEPDHPDVLQLTGILQQLTPLLATLGFQIELREPYREYKTNACGRDLKITHSDTPAYYAAIKAIARSDGTHFVAQSATFVRPGLVRRAWPAVTDRDVLFTEIARFMTAHYAEFRQQETLERELQR